MPVADLFAQVANMHIYRSVAHHDIGAPHIVIDLFAREESSGLRVQQRQQVELFSREHDLLSAARDQMTFAIHHYGLVRDLVVVAPLQHGPNPACEGFELYRFCDIVVGPGVEPAHLRIFIPACGQKDYQRIVYTFGCSDQPARLEPVHDGHHGVEQYQMRMPGEGFIDPFAPVGGGFDLVALFPEVVSDEFENVGLVVDYQYSVCHDSQR